MRSRGSWIKRVVAGAAAAGLFCLLWSVWDHDAAVEWLRQARPLPFFALMASLPMFGVPMTPFLIVAGAAFGTQVGVAGSMIALALNLGGCYMLGRSVRPWLEPLWKRLGFELPNFDASDKSAIRFTLAVKFVPGIPTFVKNYGLAVAGVDFLPYFGLSMLFTGTYGIFVVALGESLFDHDRTRVQVVAAVLAALALGAFWWRRHAQRQTAARM